MSIILSLVVENCEIVEMAFIEDPGFLIILTDVISALISFIRRGTPN